jgi:hypothetical protein
MPQSPKTSNQRSYKRAVEVEIPVTRDLSHLNPADVMLRHLALPADQVPTRSREADLSHLDPYDPMLRIARVSTIMPVTPTQEVQPPIDITTLFTENQMKSYVRRLKVRKIRLFACAAREQKPRAVYSDHDVNSVLVDGHTLTALVRANMDKFKVCEEDLEEMDNTIKSNPKAFWFGQPETPEEVQQYIDERIINTEENLADDTDITPDHIEQLRALVAQYPHHLRTRLGNDMAAKIPPLKITLKEGCEPKKIKLYSMKPNARKQMD